MFGRQAHLRNMQTLLNGTAESDFRLMPIAGGSRNGVQTMCGSPQLQNPTLHYKCKSTTATLVDKFNKMNEILKKPSRYTFATVQTDKARARKIKNKSVTANLYTIGSMEYTDETHQENN